MNAGGGWRSHQDFGKLGGKMEFGGGGGWRERDGEAGDKDANWTQQAKKTQQPNMGAGCKSHKDFSKPIQGE